MRPLIKKMTPTRGFAHVIYIVLNILLPVLTLLLVKAELVLFAVLVVLLSKWRMFAVRPRFWWANIRANAVDIMIGLSVIGFLVSTDNEWLRLIYTTAWVAWLLYIKPKTSALMVSLQAFLGQALALVMLYTTFDDWRSSLLVLTTGAICFFAAYHFFQSFEEQHMQLLAYVWGYFGAMLAWILSHWMLFYGLVAQIALILTVIAFGLGALYYLDHFDKLSALVRRQIIFIMIATLLIITIKSDWGDKLV